ncbi:hypothetical protein [Ruania alba]|uniref:Uncharacterized protein n=1 Tax=Ruania alba TaxID=648782 RepID=A0A1H5LTI3_9MICO|nr:hypothetical protein [Ruania alba]SEE80290.1 hypothetical protein SAMN04488554_2970 [Ruania alba]
MRTSRLLAAGTTIAAAGALAACDPGPPADGLGGALESVPATEDNLRLIAWTDVSAVTELGGYDEYPHPFATAGLVGYGTLGQLTRQLDPALLPDGGSEGATALWVGEPPYTAFRFDGVDGEAVAGFFAEADGESSDLADGTLLVRRGDAEVDLEDDLLPPQVLSQMNTVWFGERTFVGSTHQTMVADLVEGTDESAADAEVYSGVTDCLGDVVAAELHSGDDPAPATSLAIGFSGSTEEPVATLCLRVDDPETMVETVTDQLTSGSDPSTQRPWQDILGEGEVTESGDWVQVQFVDPEQPDAIYQALYGGALPALMGAEIEDPRLG